MDHLIPRSHYFFGGSEAGLGLRISATNVTECFVRFVSKKIQWRFDILTVMGPGQNSNNILSWSKRLECFAKQDPGRARQSS